jgi:hypothetical protein
VISLSNDFLLIISKWRADMRIVAKCVQHIITLYSQRVDNLE